MGNIHVNTDAMRQLSGSLDYWSNYLRDGLIPSIYKLTVQLEGDWQGVSRVHYEQSLQLLNTHIMGVITQAEELSRHMIVTANQFDAADNS